MSIVVMCPDCGHGFSVESDLLDRACPACGVVFETSKPSPLKITEAEMQKPPIPPPVQVPLGEIVASPALAEPPVQAPPPLEPPVQVPVAAPVAAPVVTAAEPVAPPVAASRPIPVSAIDQTEKSPHAVRAAKRRVVVRDEERLDRASIEMFAVCGLVLLGLCGATIAGYFFVGDEETQAAVEPPPLAVSVATKPPVEAFDPESDDAGAIAADRITKVHADLRSSVVTLSIESASGAKVASGFMIDQRAWLATNYHLVKDAYEVRAEFVATEERLASDAATVVLGTGIVAVSPEHDLAILALESSRLPEFPGIKFSDADADAADVLLMYPVPHDEDAAPTACHPKRTVATTHLPDAAKAHLPDGKRDTPGLSWIELTEKLDEQAGGIPLVNSDGQVFAVAALLSNELDSAYAIPARYLAELLAGASGEVQPFLPRPGLAKDDDGVVVPTFVPGAREKFDPKVNPLGYVEIIKDLHEKCILLEWDTKSKDGFNNFQQLMTNVADALGIEDDDRFEEGVRVIATAPAHDVVSELKTRTWPRIAEIARLNKAAVNNLRTAKQPVFVYTRVVEPSRASPSVDDQPAVLLEVIGSDEQLLYPLKKHRNDMLRGHRYLVIGKVATGRISNDGAGVPIVRGKHFLRDPNF